MCRLFWVIVNYGLFVPGILTAIHSSKQCSFHYAADFLFLQMMSLLFLFLKFRFFSPLGMVPVISLVGFGLFDRGFPVVGVFIRDHLYYSSFWFPVVPHYLWKCLFLLLSGWKVCRDWYSHAHSICCLLPGMKYRHSE